MGESRITSFVAKDGNALLEGEIIEGAAPGVVLCHPHPLFGGSMDSVVIGALFEALGRAGQAVLRFNFRGVGASTGQYAGGAGEVMDVLGAVEYLREACDCATTAIAGYSFGAAVALKALKESAAVRFVAVALPTEMGTEIYGNPPVEVRVPSFLAAGDRDDICRLENVGRVAEFAGPPEIFKLPGCDHFFSSLESLDKLCENVVEFLGRQ
jgi:alpha/beta superfamily hydrolase